MGAKENLNEAMFSMFGVGKAPTAEEPAVEEVPAVKPVAKSAAVVPAPLKPVTYLAPGSCMEGKLKCQGDVDVAGIFKGDIEAEGKVKICANVSGNIKASTLELKNCRLTGDIDVAGLVILDEKAVVEGKITAGELICFGCVKGDLDIQENLMLKEKAQIEGNIAMGSLMVEQGAVIEGSISSKKK